MGRPVPGPALVRNRQRLTPDVATCLSGKTRHSSWNDLTIAGHALVRELNRQHRIAEDLFGYRCGDCRGFHLTRLAEFRGVRHRRVLVAPPAELQVWAFPPIPDSDSRVDVRVGAF